MVAEWDSVGGSEVASFYPREHLTISTARTASAVGRMFGRKTSLSSVAKTMTNHNLTHPKMNLSRVMQCLCWCWIADASRRRVPHTIVSYDWRQNVLWSREISSASTRETIAGWSVLSGDCLWMGWCSRQTKYFGHLVSGHTWWLRAGLCCEDWDMASCHFGLAEWHSPRPGCTSSIHLRNLMIGTRSVLCFMCLRIYSTAMWGDPIHSVHLCRFIIRTTSILSSSQD